MHHICVGKSTTISMLTGLLQATAGQCNIYGFNLNTHLSEIRQITGVCYQQNVIFPMLSVTEHLEFFASLKGFTGDALRAGVDRVVQEVGLGHKAHAAAQVLSGMQSRVE